MTPESKCKQALKKWLNENDYWWTSVDSRYTSGLPDIITCRSGQLVAFEAKSPTGKLSKIQEVVATKMVKAGAGYYIVRLVEGKPDFTSWEVYAANKK